MRKSLIVVSVVLAAAAGTGLAGTEDSRCRHCNSKMYGPGCHHSPTGRHEK